MSERIRLEFEKGKSTPVDIHEHMDILYELACKCNHIVEGGVRYVVSTWAFLLGCSCRGGMVDSYCWTLIPEIQRAIDICKAESVPWRFHEGDWLTKIIPQTDLLFIDTNHTYFQIKQELQLHGPKAKRFIVLHDTVRFGEVGADDKSPGLWQAVVELVEAGSWQIGEHYTNCNGLTILERIDENQ